MGALGARVDEDMGEQQEIEIHVQSVYLQGSLIINSKACLGTLLWVKSEIAWQAQTEAQLRVQGLVGSLDKQLWFCLCH